MSEGSRKMSLSMQIFIATVLAIVVGVTCQGQKEALSEYIRPFITIFLNLIKFIVVPIVLFSIMAGILSMKDIRRLGAIGVRTIVFYLCTTAIAIVIGLAVGSAARGAFPVLATSDLTYSAAVETNFMDTIVGIFPSNFIAPLSGATMLQIIVMALLLGISTILTGGERAERIARSVSDWEAVFMKCMDLILKLSPIGVFCLLVPVIAVNGPMVIGSLAMVLLVAYVCYILHAAIVYSIAVRALGGMGPLTFFRGMMPAIIFAFSSASSVGTLPINMDCTQRLGAFREVSSFVLPLGATINMDGTAIYQGVCAIFISAYYGVDLTLPQMATIVVTATLASIGTAGVPGAGMVMLAMVLTSVGLPVEGIALVAGVDRIFDMGRTTVNITGDAAAAIIVSHMERRHRA